MDWMFATDRRRRAIGSMALATGRTLGNPLGHRVLRGVRGGITGSSRR